MIIKSKLATHDDKKISQKWDEYFELDARIQRKDAGYKKACELDGFGKHTEADKALADAGVDAETIRWRRAHLNWRARQPVPQAG
jgi:hypothetical protein